ncbi:MAG: glycosyltransferase [bacterium]
MKFTGERIVPDIPEWEHLYFEHLYRYIFAKEFIKDKVVLDVACGTGYGTEFLNENKAKIVVGADICFETITYAKNFFFNPLYLQTDAVQLPFRDNVFDVVVSFETIEHLIEYENFLKEIKRILKKSGIFIVSTPNKSNYQAIGSDGKNPFHFKEFYLDEFNSLLKKYFYNIDTYGQNCNQLYKNIEGNKYIPTLKDIVINREDIGNANFFIALCRNNDFPQIPKIKLSVIMPIFNNLFYTEQCIKTILSQMNYNTEIIVINDASTENNIYNYLESMKNKIKIIHNEKNIGFLKSCNKGAQFAQGEYFLFLNNDTIPLENCFENLLETLEKNREIGAVGAKLIYPDGKLQEAGGIIFNDASGHNFGRGDDPYKQDYNYVREVDYCSGACLLVRRDLFEKTGGFDERFSPAYYEDTDLCFSIRKLGYKVIYQPKSSVVHFEGATCGRDLSSGIKRYQEINKIKFLKKWEKELKDQYCPDSKNIKEAADRKKGKKILFFYPLLPAFDRDSGGFRLFNILKILLNEGHRIIFFTHSFLETQRKYKDKLEDMGIMVVYFPHLKKGRFISTRSLRRKIFIKKLLSSDSFDIVWFVHYYMACKYLDLCKKLMKETRCITDSVDLHYLREQREAEILNDRKKFKKSKETKNKELSVFRKSDTVITITEKERKIIEEECPDNRVEIIPNIHPVIENCKNFNKREDLLFIGGYKHNPNPDAVEYFSKEIFPLIRSRINNINFYIIGEYPDHFVERITNSHIIFTGPIRDTQRYLQKCKVFVAPIRFGAGMKGKVGEALSSGIPVVTTSVGAEGMGLINGKDVLIADTSEEFARKVINVYYDENLWRTISINGRQFIEANFSPRIVRDLIKKIID